MKTVHWLFLISVVMFISGIGFVVASTANTSTAAQART